jgi:hypothetical protein
MVMPDFTILGKRKPLDHGEREHRKNAFHFSPARSVFVMEMDT